jgi:hypothetical protein
MAAIECASTVEFCAVRATRLADDGTVAPGPDNSYVVRDVIQLQFTPNIREGEDREMIGGCGGCVIGATVIEGTDGPLGFMLGEKRDCGTAQNRVAFEGWSKRWTTDDEQDPTYPWWHWLWPSVAWVPGQNTLQADFGPVVATGKTRANTAWATGPYGDEPADVAGNQLAVWADAGDLPAGTCAYSTVT